MSTIDDAVKHAMGAHIGYDPDLLAKRTAKQAQHLADKLREIARGAISANNSRELVQCAFQLTALSDQFEAGLHRGSIMRSDLARILLHDINLAWFSMSAAWAVTHRVDDVVYDLVKSTVTVTELPAKVDLSPYIEVPD